MTAVASTTSNSVFGSSATSVSTSASTSSSNALGNAASQQDRFLKLLVAQMNNQDPMSPMDNSQLTSQTAQISTVSGIEKLNSTITSLASQFSSMQSLQGVSLIGHSTLSNGNALNVSNGTGQGVFNLSSAADTVSVKVLTPGGQVLDTVQLGALASGQHSFSWNAANYTGTGTPTFQVTATQAGTNVPLTTLQLDTISGVSSSNTAGLTLQMQSGASVPYSSVQSIF